MNDDTPPPVNTMVDRHLDKIVEVTTPPREAYTNSGVGKLPLADKPAPLSTTIPTKRTGMTVADIERVVTKEALRTPRQRIEQFAVNMARKSDLRLRQMSQRLGLDLRREHRAAMTTGPISSRVRAFDIQAQTARLASANAVLGTYQFQKTMVLPFMRKSLTLGYQKVSILKEVSSGIRSLEKAIVSKLEAIKINTASTAPRHQSILKRVMNDVGFLNIRRVSGNISEMMMDGWDKRYRKFVTPFAKKVHEKVSDDSVGSDGRKVRFNLTTRLNRLRHSLRQRGEEEGEKKGWVNKLNSLEAKVGSKVAGAAALHLPKAQAFLSNVSETFSRFQPFSKAGPDRSLVDEDDIRPTRSKDTDLTDLRVTPHSSDLTKSFNEWRQEYKTNHTTIVGRLDAITGAIEDTGHYDPSAKKPKRSPSRRNSHMQGRRRTILDSVVTPETFDVETEEAPRDLDRVVKSAKKKRSSFYGLFDIFNRQSEQPAQVRSYDSHIEKYRKTVNPSPDRAFFSSMVEEVKSGLEKVNTTLDRTNAQRTKFEEQQSKWHDQAEKDKPKEVRKNSYEDVQAQKAKNNKGALGKTARRAAASAATTGGKLLQGDLVGAAGNALGDAFDYVKDEVSDRISDRLSDRKDDVPNKRRKRSRLARKVSVGKNRLGRRLGGLIRGRGGALATVGGLGLGAVGAALGDDDESDTPNQAPATKPNRVMDTVNDATSDVGTQAAGEKVARTVSKRGRAAVPAKKGLVRKVASLGWKATKGVTRLGAKGVGSLLAGGGRMALKAVPFVAKTTLPALAVGAVADGASGWLEKNTTGAVKRAGTTVAEMAKWGTTGAAIGSVIPGLGTGVGAALGAAVGAVAANADLLSKGFEAATMGVSTFGTSVAKTGESLWTSIFGEDAKFDNMGRVKRRETASLYQNIKASLFGRDTKYSKSGDIILQGKTGVMGSLTAGISTFIFGEEMKDGTIKPGTSLMARFQTQMDSLLDSIKSGITGTPSALVGAAKGAYSWMTGNGYDTGSSSSGGGGSYTAKSGDIYKGRGKPVADASTVVKELVPEARITSHRRSGGGVGNAGNKSWHNKSGAAIDVAPIKGMTFEQYKQKFADAGYAIIEAIDETNPATMKKTGATGPHWHIVLGEKGSGSRGGGGAVSGESKERASKAIAHLTKKGWTPTAAKGITYNLFGESGLDTKAFNDKNGGQGAQGIAQWRGQRITDIERHFGKTLGNMSLEEQLDAVDWELRDGKHVTNSKAIIGGSLPIVDALNSATSTDSVIKTLVHRYERPAVEHREQAIQRRISDGISIERALGMDAPKPAPKAEPKPGQAQPKAATPKAAEPKLRQGTSLYKDPSAVTDAMLNSMNNLAGVITKHTAAVTATPPPAKAQPSTTVVAPTFVNNGTRWPTTGVTASMAKTNFRTGN